LIETLMTKGPLVGFAGSVLATSSSSGMVTGRGRFTRRGFAGASQKLKKPWAFASAEASVKVAIATPELSARALTRLAPANAVTLFSVMTDTARPHSVVVGWSHSGVIGLTDVS
jgi:hypothetical protein